MTTNWSSPATDEMGQTRLRTPGGERIFCARELRTPSLLVPTLSLTRPDFNLPQRPPKTREPSNPRRSRGFVECRRQDSNLRHADYDSAALTD